MEQMQDEVRAITKNTRRVGRRFVRKKTKRFARERGWQKKQCCDEPSRGCKISNGVYGSTVQPFRVHHAASRHCTRKAMTGGCRRLWPLCWKISRGTRVNREWQASWQHFPGFSFSGEDCPCSILGFMERHTSHDPPASPPHRPLLHSSGGEWRSKWLCGRIAQRLCHTRSERFCRTTIVGPVEVRGSSTSCGTQNRQHGWQYYVFLSRTPSSGDRSACLLLPIRPTCVPTRALERARWRQPSQSGASVVGRHRAACPRSGRFRTRAVVPERTLARVCREAGAAVRRNVKLRDIHHSAW